MKKLFLSTAIIGFISLTQSCKKEPEVPVPQEKGAYVTVMHACPGGGSVNAKIENTYHSLSQKLNYLNITGYYTVPAGNYRINFHCFPIPKVLATGECSLEYNKHYIALVVGQPDRARVLIAENTPLSPAAGKANVRFINTSSDSCQVDLQQDGLPLFTDVEYKEVTPYSEINAGSVTFTTKKNADGNALTQNSFNLESQKNYTFLLTGSENGTGEDAISLTSIRY